MADVEMLEVLKRMEQNQLKALEMQTEQLAAYKAQMERTEARVHESITLQKVAIARQAKALQIVLPLIGLALLYVAYLLFKYA